MPNIVASSQLLARLCYPYLSSSLQPNPTSIVLLPLLLFVLGKLSLFASYAMLSVRPRNLKAAANKIYRRQLARSGVSPGTLLHETAVHGCQQSGSLFLWQFKEVKPAINVATVPNMVALSQLLVCLCYLYFCYQYG